MKRKRYENLDQVSTAKTFKDLRNWRKERRGKNKDLSFQVPSVQPEVQFLHTNKTEPTITWIGHSTFLIQINEKNILTDPVWANQLGIDKRLTPPGIHITDLPPIDIVLISHSHYDHLHYSSIKKLKGNPRFLVPVGLGQWFRKRKFQHVIEFSWWDEQKVVDLDFTFTPAQHWTKRTLTDTNRSHWGGWILNNDNTCIYFAGDSGYFKGFQEMGKRHSIDYCLMPIGAYEPEWFMSSQHVNPEEAVQAFIDTGAKYMVPMHYGAYRLADDTPKEALDRLCTDWDQRELERERLKVMKIGETIRL
ncbi:MBL fold metallo-hydrolase [Bacillus sp. FJAT-49711]|uniref:MBL fold metallo-hydrolase n=1 Tax=Bacillus sp. FJAT-49711 TaxID=2833585 RepID=UPI001BCA009F|nr:MBL fold metallo-hydrolase [Bacillus sp. FJAT-49711]MBS4220354.1 MBL fold metallo-hydrolase [Bacillus sp. FJAT-49711]